jgi:hypothetical protein
MASPRWSRPTSSSLLSTHQARRDAAAPRDVASTFAPLRPRSCGNLLVPVVAGFSIPPPPPPPSLPPPPPSR